MACDVSSLSGGYRSNPYIRHSPADGNFLLLAAFEVAPSSGEPAEKELLGQACANSFSRADSKISKHQSGATIGLGIVEVRKSRRRQVSA